MATYGENGTLVFMNKWYISIPLHLILLEILIVCVLRTVYAIVLINKYRHKREECYKPPILDENYYGGAPEYVKNQAKKDSPLDKMSVNEGAKK